MDGAWTPASPLEKGTCLSQLFHEGTIKSSYKMTNQILVWIAKGQQFSHVTLHTHQF